MQPRITIETARQILGVEEKATVGEIRQAYHKAALVYHPDKYHGDDSNDQFNQIVNAYKVLSELNGMRDQNIDTHNRMIVDPWHAEVTKIAADYVADLLCQDEADCAEYKTTAKEKWNAGSANVNLTIDTEDECYEDFAKLRRKQACKGLVDFKEFISEYDIRPVIQALCDQWNTYSWQDKKYASELLVYFKEFLPETNLVTIIHDLQLKIFKKFEPRYFEDCLKALEVLAILKCVLTVEIIHNLFNVIVTQLTDQEARHVNIHVISRLFKIMFDVAPRFHLEKIADSLFFKMSNSGFILETEECEIFILCKEAISLERITIIIKNLLARLKDEQEHARYSVCKMLQVLKPTIPSHYHADIVQSLLPRLVDASSAWAALNTYKDSLQKKDREEIGTVLCKQLQDESIAAKIEACLALHDFINILPFNYLPIIFNRLVSCMVYSAKECKDVDRYKDIRDLNTLAKEIMGNLDSKLIPAQIAHDLINHYCSQLTQDITGCNLHLLPTLLTKKGTEWHNRQTMYAINENDRNNYVFDNKGSRFYYIKSDGEVVPFHMDEESLVKFKASLDKMMGDKTTSFVTNDQLKKLCPISKTTYPHEQWDVKITACKMLGYLAKLIPKQDFEKMMSIIIQLQGRCQMSQGSHYFSDSVRDLFDDTLNMLLQCIKTLSLFLPIVAEELKEKIIDSFLYLVKNGHELVVEMIANVFPNIKSAIPKPRLIDFANAFCAKLNDKRNFYQQDKNRETACGVLNLLMNDLTDQQRDALLPLLSSNNTPEAKKVIMYAHCFNLSAVKKLRTDAPAQQLMTACDARSNRGNNYSNIVTRFNSPIHSEKEPKKRKDFSENLFHKKAHRNHH